MRERVIAGVAKQWCAVDDRDDRGVASAITRSVSSLTAKAIVGLAFPRKRGPGSGRPA
jgi:hypothetical protein